MDILKMIKEVLSPPDEDHVLHVTYTKTRKYEGEVEVDKEEFVITSKKLVDN